jgi:Flp pilus assembly pilin Flp
MIRRIRSDERGLTKVEWLGVILLVLVLLSLIPQFRSALDWFYETLVGKNNVGPDGEPKPGVFVRGLIVAFGSLAVFAGTVFVINYTNLGRRLAFLVTGAAFFGFLAIVGLLYTLYSPRGLRPTLIDGLNAFQLRILPGALMVGSIILFAMFVAAMARLEEEED